MISDSAMSATAKDVNYLFYLIGEAVCMIQFLEDALSHSITLKQDVQYPYPILKKDAEAYLNKYQSRTLGNAITIAKEKDLYTDKLQNELSDFLKERNWLIHKCAPHHIDDLLEASGRDQLFNRIKAITQRAIYLRKVLEIDMIEFSEERGLDMSRVRSVMKKAYLD